MVEFEFTTWERLVLKDVLQCQTRRDLSLKDVRAGLAVLDALDFSDDERKAIQLKIGPGGLVEWDIQAEGAWVMEMSREHAAWLASAALIATGYPRDEQALALEDKLKAAQDEIKKRER